MEKEMADAVEFAKANPVLICKIIDGLASIDGFGQIILDFHDNEVKIDVLPRKRIGKVKLGEPK